MLTEFIQIGTLVIGIVTAWILIRTFQRDRKHELENQLYKTRLEALSNITFELNNFFNHLDYAIVQLEIIENHPNKQQIKEKIIELSLFMDKEIRICQSRLIKGSVCFTDKSTRSLFNFSRNLDNTVDWDDIDLKAVTNYIEVYYDQQLAKADKAIAELRDELQLDKLHLSLFKRLK